VHGQWEETAGDLASSWKGSKGPPEDRAKLALAAPRRLLAFSAQLIALIKRTFELHTATLADQPQQVRPVVQPAARAPTQ
jgi:hypothetical protein